MLETISIIIGVLLILYAALFLLPGIANLTKEMWYIKNSDKDPNGMDKKMQCWYDPETNSIDGIDFPLH